MHSISNVFISPSLVSRPCNIDSVSHDAETANGDSRVTQAINVISNTPEELTSAVTPSQAKSQSLFSRLLAWVSPSRFQTNATTAPPLREWDQQDATYDEQRSLSSCEVDMEAVLEAEMQRTTKQPKSNKLLLLGGMALVATTVGAYTYNKLQADTTDTSDAMPTPQPWVSALSQSSPSRSRLSYRYNFGLG